mmetsp:Transcript_3245/g.9910  ORF Transcript_3245/g.9910 Transcript_3245/m.9910 type:complete len:254 (+) Transcript_3245:1722-2483(+)
MYKRAILHPRTIKNVELYVSRPMVIKTSVPRRSPRGHSKFWHPSHPAHPPLELPDWTSALVGVHQYYSSGPAASLQDCLHWHPSPVVLRRSCLPQTSSSPGVALRSSSSSAASSCARQGSSALPEPTPVAHSAGAASSGPAPDGAEPSGAVAVAGPAVLPGPVGATAVPAVASVLRRPADPAAQRPAAGTEPAAGPSVAASDPAAGSVAAPGAVEAASAQQVRAQAPERSSAVVPAHRCCSGSSSAGGWPALP